MRIQEFRAVVTVARRGTAQAPRHAPIVCDEPEISLRVTDMILPDSLARGMRAVRVLPVRPDVVERRRVSVIDVRLAVRHPARRQQFMMEVRRIVYRDLG